VAAEHNSCHLSKLLHPLTSPKTALQKAPIRGTVFSSVPATYCLLLELLHILKKYYIFIFIIFIIFIIDIIFTQLVALCRRQQLGV